MSRFVEDRNGATAIEYGLIAGLLGIVIIVSLGALGTTIRDDVFGMIATTLNDAADS
ncbi:Flp family type IVb pilin [Roseibium sp. MMSF_3544]|uniref:Flp family type IVb pilin n=1 Tax=unclassified Roseibium TaxID=2629323 RepID=UPI00273FFA38|nr:Flp family type IVb pilin [Roseibium sp. MMSF_3544]